MTQWTIPNESQRASPERIRQFLDEHGSSPLRHASEFLPLLHRDDPVESRINAHEVQLDEELRKIYRLRAKTTAKAPPSPNYPPGLADDVRELVVQLDAAPDQALCLWRIALPSGICFIVFELLDDRRIAGCVKSADQRIVDPRTQR